MPVASLLAAPLLAASLHSPLHSPLPVGSLHSQLPQPPRPSVSSRALLAPAAEDEGWLFAALDAGDRSFVPRIQAAPGGRVTIHYRRTGAQGPLDAAQVLALMRQPPRHERQRAAIRTLLRQLRAIGVTLRWAPLPHSSAAALWDPRRGVLQLRPDLPASGSEELARVLNHEGIHVAQSCFAGGLRLPPQPLGLGLRPDPLDRPLLEKPPYRQITPLQRQLEEEAFGGQWDLSLGPRLLAQHCKAPQPPARLGS